MDTAGLSLWRIAPSPVTAIIIVAQRKSRPHAVVLQTITGHVLVYSPLLKHSAQREILGKQMLCQLAGGSTIRS